MIIVTALLMLLFLIIDAIKAFEHVIQKYIVSKVRK